MNSKHLATGSKFPPLQEGKLRIYSMRFCPYAQRALLVLEAKKIPHEIINVNLKQKPEWLFERNPTGKVPTIETAQGPLYESIIICEYLDEIYPNRKLVSSDPYQRALDKIWIENSSTLSRIYYQIISGRNDEAEVTANRFKDFAEALLPFEKELKRRGTLFFAGSEPGILDYGLWPWFERIPLLKLVFPKYDFENAKAEHPTLEKWRKAMKEDSAVKASYVPPQIHRDFILSFFAGTPNYELLLE